jgi:hypothetical protein
VAASSPILHSMRIQGQVHRQVATQFGDPHRSDPLILARRQCGTCTATLCMLTSRPSLPLTLAPCAATKDAGALEGTRRLRYSTQTTRQSTLRQQVAGGFRHKLRAVFATITPIFLPIPPTFVAMRCKPWIAMQSSPHNVKINLGPREN